MAKVYISCHHPDPANALARVLTSAGHEVVSGWHAEARERPPLTAVEAWQAKALANLKAIESADALVVLCDGQPHPGGKWVEAGLAYPKAAVFVLGALENGMSHLFQRVWSEAGLLEALKRLC